MRLSSEGFGIITTSWANGSMMASTAAERHLAIVMASI
jgi:hypothetical protein